TCQRTAVAQWLDLVAIAMDHQHGRIKVLRKCAEGAATAYPLPPGGRDQSLRIGVQCPPDTVLDRLGRVRVRKAARDEPRGEPRVVLPPVHGVHVPPPPVDAGPLEQRR